MERHTLQHLYNCDTAVLIFQHNKILRGNAKKIEGKGFKWNVKCKQEIETQSDINL